MDIHMNSKKYLLVLSCLSVHLYASAWLLLDGFSWNLILYTFTKICPGTEDVVNTKHYQALYVKTSVYAYWWWQYEIFCSLTIVLWEPILAFPWQCSVVVYCWQLHVAQQQYKVNTLSYFTMALVLQAHHMHACLIFSECVCVCVLTENKSTLRIFK